MTSITRRALLGSTAAASVAYATGPLIAQKGELPSQKIRVGVMDSPDFKLTFGYTLF